MKIEFNIGSYQDKVLCDITPMDVCDVLLGTPWEFDKNQFMIGGKMHILLTRMVKNIYCSH